MRESRKARLTGPARAMGARGWQGGRVVPPGMTIGPLTLERALPILPPSCADSIAPLRSHRPRSQEPPMLGDQAPSGVPLAPSGGPQAPSGGPQAPSGGPQAPRGGPHAPSGGPQIVLADS